MPNNNNSNSKINIRFPRGLSAVPASHSPSFSPSIPSSVLGSGPGGLYPGNSGLGTAEEVACLIHSFASAMLLDSLLCARPCRSFKAATSRKPLLASPGCWVLCSMTAWRDCSQSAGGSSVPCIQLHLPHLRTAFLGARFGEPSTGDHCVGALLVERTCSRHPAAAFLLQSTVALSPNSSQCVCVVEGCHIPLSEAQGNLLWVPLSELGSGLQTRSPVHPFLT